MTKRNIILSAAISAVFAGAATLATAGTITSTADRFAIENIATTATPVTLSNIVYNLGVGRTTTQPFTLIYTLSGTAQFNVTPTVPTAAGGTCAIVGSSLKRGGANSSETAFDIVVSGNCSATDTLTLVAPVIKTHGLTAAGNTVSMSIALKDVGETSFIDNAGALTSTRATAAFASDFFNPATTTGGVATDTNTVIDAGATPPLTRFLANVAVPADTAAVAAAAVRVNNTTGGVRNAANTADYTLGATDLVSITVTDPSGFLGLAASGLCYDVDGDGTNCEAGEVFTVTGNTALLNGLNGTSLGFNAVRNLIFTNTGTTAMGTGRTLGIAGSVTPAAGTAHAFTGNAGFWPWTSNGVTLQSPWFSTAAGYISRFALTNTGASDATYSSTCLVDGANTFTLGPNALGAIPAGKEILVDASSVCVFGGAQRGGVVFTVNAPSTAIQAIYNIVSPSGAQSVSNMMRPGTN